MMGLEPTTFCMASRRSSQLSYIRVGGQYSPGPGRSRLAPPRHLVDEKRRRPMACRRFARHPRLAHPSLQRAAIRVPRLLDARRTLLLALDPSTPLEGGLQLELFLADPELFPRQA